MNIGRMITGSQFPQKAEHIEFPTSMRERSVDDSNVGLNKMEQQTGTESIQNEINADDEKSNIEKMIESMNKFFEPTHTSLQFELHEKLDRYYVTVVDTITNEVVKEIPPKKMLEKYAAMAEFMGFLVDEKR